MPRTNQQSQSQANQSNGHVALPPELAQALTNAGPAVMRPQDFTTDSNVQLTNEEVIRRQGHVMQNQYPARQQVQPQQQQPIYPQQQVQYPQQQQSFVPKQVYSSIPGQQPPLNINEQSVLPQHQQFTPQQPQYQQFIPQQQQQQPQLQYQEQSPYPKTQQLLPQQQQQQYPQQQQQPQLDPQQTQQLDQYLQQRYGVNIQQADQFYQQQGSNPDDFSRQLSLNQLSQAWGISPQQVVDRVSYIGQVYNDVLSQRPELDTVQGLQQIWDLHAASHPQTPVQPDTGSNLLGVTPTQPTYQFRMSDYNKLPEAEKEARYQQFLYAAANGQVLED